jgi:BlaI family penicillinase repressor
MSRKALSALEQLVMDYVWAHPRTSASACRDGIAATRPLKENTVRTLLQRLEAKGYVRHDTDGRTFLYSAVEPRTSIAAQAVRQIIDRFCGGSVEELLAGMVAHDVVDRRELEEFSRKIAAKKKEVR